MHDIQAGLPQGSPVSPVLFILSVSAMFQWLETRHPKLHSLSFVDDVGLLLKCDTLDEGIQELESVAGHAIEWGAANKVEFEVSKTGVLIFSKRRKILQAAKQANVRIGEHSCPINQGATKWLGFWLDSKLTFKTHFENRITSARRALQAVASLSRRNGGLSIRLMRRVVIAAVSSVALFGAEVWWRGQKDLERRLQLLLNSQARTITGLLKCTPIAFLLQAACFPYAGDLLDQRQTRFATRALAAARDHPTHQLLPANFRFGELYRHEGATGQPSSVGWIRPDKAHRLFGSRLAQKVSRHVTYDTEHGFDLLERSDTRSMVVATSTGGRPQAVSKAKSSGLDKITLFVCAAKDISFGAAVGWVAGCRDKVKSDSLGKYLTMLDVDLYAIRMAVHVCRFSLPGTVTRCTEILSDSRQALSAIEKAGHWTTPLIRDIKHQIRVVQERGDEVILITAMHR
ncbi:hypothetical protein KC320_g5991 [Hortaea werneckii]|nr:hypothetical protein KC320_g5991 [Hortaea werneckii]